MSTKVGTHRVEEFVKQRNSWGHSHWMTQPFSLRVALEILDPEERFVSNVAPRERDLATAVIEDFIANEEKEWELRWWQQVFATRFVSGWLPRPGTALLGLRFKIQYDHGGEWRDWQARNTSSTNEEGRET